MSIEDAPTGAPTGAPSQPRGGKLMKSLPAILMLLFFFYLLKDHVGVSASRQELGPITVSVALTPEPTQVGGALMHVQLNLKDSLAAVENVTITAEQLDPAGSKPVPVTGKAMSGSYELAFLVPNAGTTQLALHFMAGAPLGTITYEVTVGQEGAKVLSVQDAANPH